MTILVCGDAMVDRYIFGDVTRISPEAPVPILRGERIEERAGGAANVVANIQALGCECEGLFGSSHDGPIIKIRVIGRSQQMLRIDFDCPQLPVSVAHFEEELPKCSIVVFSDYGKGSLSNVQELIRLAKAAGKTVLVDPKGFDYERYRGADLIKPNKDEMKELVGGWHTEEQLTEKALDLCRKLKTSILLTRAAEGMTIYTDGLALRVASVVREVFDVSGAGDTAIAAFAVAVHYGWTWDKAMEFANKAAAIVVGRFGTAVATKEEVFG